MTEGFLFGAPQGPWVRVALDMPVRREFSYEVPEGMNEIQPGCRARVLFGSRYLIGVVVGLDPHPPEGVKLDRIRPVAALLDKEPILTLPLLRLARHMADTTFCSWGAALAAMLPAALRKDRKRRMVKTVEWVGGLDGAQQKLLEESFPKQERALAYLKKADGPVEVRLFKDRTGLSDSPLKTLEKKGWVKFAKRKEYLNPFAESPVSKGSIPTLTAQQEQCVNEIVHSLEARQHQDYLLFGITGSGKTEVYLRALATCLKQGRGAIVLVPEISLTPQTVARFRERCGEVAVLHSGLTDAERHDQWIAIQEGKLRVVVGARSALFAPVPDLGLIVVDEEHESTFKQESVPRYHARELAQERAHLEKAVCVLGSATPSLESWCAAQKPGGMRLLELRSRVAGGALPEVLVVDMRSEKPETGHWLVVSKPLEVQMGKALEKEEKVILFLNQRGFAPAWHCKICGGSVHCKQCDVALTYHRWRKKALCHYCMEETPPPRVCPECHHPVGLVGVGTERAEDTVERMFPKAQLARMDRDTMLRRESYEEVLRGFGAGESQILLGTQMVAKGLDFPDVTVVGVLNADTALHHPDFRASERCFNLVTQVSGRAGRSDLGGRVVVQTWMPDHPAIRFSSKHDYRGFAEGELKEREMFGYPPFGAAIRFQFEAADVLKVESMAAAAAAQLQEVSAPGCVLMGPAPPPVEKIKGRVRRQILLKATPPDALRPLLPVLYELCQKTGVTVDRL